jgi:DNA-directed RNA polymerase subunit M/transcription elongation factor TFIIS
MIRTLARNALATKLTRSENIDVFERYAYEQYKDNDKDYINAVYQLVYDIAPDNLENVLKNLKEGKYGWSHDSLSMFRDIEYEQDAFIIQPFEIIEGIVECRCGSKRVYSFSKQTRSGDESITTFNECLICKKKWVYSG